LEVLDKGIVYPYVDSEVTLFCHGAPDWPVVSYIMFAVGAVVDEDTGNNLNKEETTQQQETTATTTGGDETDDASMMIDHRATR
jgi:hypothetical protein